MARGDWLLDGMKARRKAREAEMRALLASGVDEKEAVRRVYWPIYTPHEWDAKCAEYDRIFGVPPKPLREE